MLFVLIFSIDWYLNSPHWTFISLDMLHKRVLCHVLIWIDWSNFKTFFAFWVNRP
jgi:hypothetical protein